MSVVAEVALFVVVLVQGVLLVGLLREVGLIQVRIGPSFAMSNEEGPPVGSTAPVVTLNTEVGGEAIIGGMRSKAQLLAFISPGCGTCHALVGPLGLIGRSESDILDVVAVCAGQDEDCREFFRPVRDSVIVVNDRDASIRSEFNVQGSPFALVVDKNGVVGESGVVNNLQQIEFLLRSLERSGELLIAGR